MAPVSYSGGKKHGKLEEEQVAGDVSSICKFKPEKESKKKEKRTKKKKEKKHNPNPDPDGEVKEKEKEKEKEKMVLDAGSKEEEGSSKSSMASMAEDGGKTKKMKLVPLRLSEELLEYLRTQEVMGYLASDAPRPLPVDPSISQDLFDPQLKQEIAAQVNKNREFDAFVLYQYRTEGYAEIQEEVTDDEHEQEV